MPNILQFRWLLQYVVGWIESSLRHRIYILLFLSTHIPFITHAATILHNDTFHFLLLVPLHIFKHIYHYSALKQQPLTLYMSCWEKPTTLSQSWNKRCWNIKGEPYRTNFRTKEILFVPVFSSLCSFLNFFQLYIKKKIMKIKNAGYFQKRLSSWHFHYLLFRMVALQLKCCWQPEPTGTLLKARAYILWRCPTD